MSVWFGSGCLACALVLLPKMVYILFSVNLYFVTFMYYKVFLAGSDGGDWFGECGFNWKSF